MNEQPPSQLSTDALYELLRPVTVRPESPRSRFYNWAHTYTCKPVAVFEPEHERQCELIVELARREGKTVRAAGVGHSPSDLPCTKDFLVRVTKLNRLLEANYEKRYIVVESGITLVDLNEQLLQHNLALTSIGSISEQTLAGTIVTVNHGSGLNYGTLSTHVLELTILLADGSKVRCSREELQDLFMATICGLGSTGLILTIKFEVEPAFRLEERRFALTFDEAMESFFDLAQRSQHTRLWWFPQTNLMQVSLADRTDKPKHREHSWLWETVIGYHLVQLLLFLGLFAPTLNVWAGRLVSWLIQEPTDAVDDSHCIFNVEHRYWQYTIEYAVDYREAPACLRDLRKWLDKEHSDPCGLRPHFPIEIRFSSADDIWLSPSNGRTTCWIGIAQYKPYGLDVPYRRLFDEYGAIIARHGGRPHWAKAHHLRPEEVRKLYPKFDDFLRTVKKYDPSGMFRNEYVGRHIFGASGPEYYEGVFLRYVPLRA
ncbi:gulonolactone oxidase Lgo1 [Gloeophyllum trabeum ATCC 11539]|uniref:D-arabinono-1,4-lactone oxidase n=1 Tax=Gloeophyllum trabeum (strain ATCC 11539 / FP-39264 / Madison 617) TaxID=670483 RepID=S7Q2Y2_GLOTA|nr:gulonolactone oxidase Lgo1 [Gloeophyllum trabeum ATCC 11539]EPQ54361.1 gulonolactone oxidase Lgo1 [Gloeophyllum trabeum ATCC 11539]